jgi:lysozyme family protein
METNREACFAIVRKALPSGLDLPPELIWDSCRCGFMPAGLDLFLLDTGVVCGFDPTLRWLRMALRVNGELAASELAKVAGTVPTRPVIVDIESYRKRALRSMPGWIDYHTRWTNRCIQIKRQAIKMVNATLEAAASAHHQTA